MNREDIIAKAREAGASQLENTPGFIDYLERFAAIVEAKKEQVMVNSGWRQCAKGQKTTQFCGQLEAAVQAERQKVAQWMTQRSYATGHGDTVEDLLKELEWQAKERGQA